MHIIEDRLRDRSFFIFLVAEVGTAIKLLLCHTLVPPSHYSTECFGGITPKALIRTYFYSETHPF